MKNYFFILKDNGVVKMSVLRSIRFRIQKLKYGIILLFVIIVFWTLQIQLLEVIQGTSRGKSRKYYIDANNPDSGNFIDL